MNVLLTADEIAHHPDDSDAAALVARDGVLPTAEARFARSERGRHLIVARANPTDATAPEGVITVKAVVVLGAGTTLTGHEVVDHCRQHLAAYIYPRHVEFRDALPKGPTRKVLKRELRG